MKTYILLEVDHTDKATDLLDKIAGRAWTIDGVKDVKATVQPLKTTSETARGKNVEVVPYGWQPIETAPRDRRMFVVQAFNVETGLSNPSGGYRYTTDPWCVWKNSDGTLSRWPHEFPPTHWQPLPPAPQPQNGDKT